MVVYVAFIAVLNLALGYGLAIYLGAGRRRTASYYPAHDETSYSDDYEDDEYESDDSYNDAAEVDEYKSAVS